MFPVDIRLSTSHGLHRCATFVRMVFDMRLSRRSFLSAAGLGSFAAAPLLSFAAKKGPSEYPLYIGAYTQGTSKGILMATFDTRTGAISTPELVAATPNPTFLAIHPSKAFLYAVNEIGNWKGQRTGSVGAYAIGAGGKLQLLNEVSSMGDGPCHVALDKAGHVAVVANYGGGTIASYKVQADGKLSEAVTSVRFTGFGPNKQRQAAPHAHSNTFSLDNRYLVSADLGTDRLHLFDVNLATAALDPHEPKFVRTIPGSGPRHFTFHPSDLCAYVNNELTNSVTAFRWDHFAGQLTELQTISTLPDDFKGQSSTAEIRIHPQNGRLYVSNRGHDSITVFDIDKQGKLTRVDITPVGGKTPRNFNFDPSGRWLLAANQDSNNITVFEVGKNGRLRATAESAQCGAPVCLKFLA